LRLVPHAHDGVRPDAPQRPLHASAHAGRDHRLEISQRLQPVPRGQERRVADNLVRAWRPRITKAPVLRQAGLVTPPGSGIGSGCRRCWLIWRRRTGRGGHQPPGPPPEGMPGREEETAFIKALSDPSPLVRGAAAAALAATSLRNPCTPSSRRPGTTSGWCVSARPRRSPACRRTGSGGWTGDRWRWPGRRRKCPSGHGPDDHASPLQPGELLPRRRGAEEGHRRIPRPPPDCVQTACRRWSTQRWPTTPSGEGECGEVAAPAVKIAPENVATAPELGCWLGRWGRRRRRKRSSGRREADPKCRPGGL